jgi:hypothetical protein
MQGRNNLENGGIDGRIILKLFLKKWGVGAWTGFIWLRPMAGSCKHSNEPSDSNKVWEFLHS